MFIPGYRPGIMSLFKRPVYRPSRIRDQHRDPPLAICRWTQCSGLRRYEFVGALSWLHPHRSYRRVNKPSSHGIRVIARCVDTGRTSWHKLQDALMCGEQLSKVHLLFLPYVLGCFADPVPSPDTIASQFVRQGLF